MVQLHSWMIPGLAREHSHPVPVENNNNQPANAQERLTALIYTLRTLESQRALLELHLIYGSLLVMTTSKFESIADHAVASELQLIQCSAP